MMDEIIELENIVSDDGMCVLHLMSNLELSAEALTKYNAPANAKIEIKKEAGAHHLRATWAMRGATRVVAEGWPVPKLFVLWNLAGCQSVTDAVCDAAKYYQGVYGVLPEYAFMRKLPGRVMNGVEIGDLMLFEAEWMVRKCVAVGWLYK